MLFVEKEFVRVKFDTKTTMKIALCRSTPFRYFVLEIFDDDNVGDVLHVDEAFNIFSIIVVLYLDESPNIFRF